MYILGLFHSHSDPSAALLANGEVVGFIEEERLLRNKHAVGQFPIKAIDYLLKENRIQLSDVAQIVQAWDCPAYDSGEMAAIYEKINAEYPTNSGDIAYQKKHLSTFTSENQQSIIRRNLQKHYGLIDLPPISFVEHHLAHACMAYFHSGMDETLVLVVDGSGEWRTTSWWLGQAGKLSCLDVIPIPHSLGWFYSAFTEYLGFQAYDGEYKVMGLAAYGDADATLREKLAQIIWYDDDNPGRFKTDPMLLSRGARSYSYYYPDRLIDFIGRPPRAEDEEITPWHMSLAFEVQQRLEEMVMAMTAHWTKKTGIKNLAIAGGVGLNVKMNGNLFLSEHIDDLFVHPLSADAGISIGAGMAYQYNNATLPAPAPLAHIYYGPNYTDAELEKVLKACKLSYTFETDISQAAAELLASGKIVGWFQGRMEAGPRALGCRSILADPRHIESRDKVNAIIKFREFWRPFCPSMTAAGAQRYLHPYTNAPFMIITFLATEQGQREVPAVVHVDGSSRPQIVDQESNPRYYDLIEEFAKLTGVPCVLNTSFNIKGEPIVCTPHDAIRTFSATGLDALAIGSFLLQKQI